MKTFLMLLLMATPAVAGERYCNENLRYDIEQTSNGYSVVRISSADHCEPAASGGDYICEDREDYRLGFTVENDVLTLTYTDGRQAKFLWCE